jgi:CheY-like chemotaxis protein
MNLLIVEDEPSTRALLSQIFVQLGHQVSSASDGFSALAQIRERVPDVIVSDLNMPGMSGFELLSVVRRRLPAIHVIATSGAYTGEDVPHGIAADAFYEKASDLRSLLTLMEIAAHRESSPLRNPDAFAPIWISGPDGDLATTVIKISCPECLRVFSHPKPDPALLIHQAICEFCHTQVHYALVQPLDPETSQPYL